MDIDKKIRDTTIKSISEYFDKKTSKDIEKSINDFSIEFSLENETPFLVESIYNTKTSELLEQFKESKKLVELIKRKDYQANKVAFLKTEQLHPEKYEKIIKKKKLEEAKKKDKATTNAFKCSKCGERKANVEEKQTRAGDEPATVFVTCQVCGNMWTIA